MRSPTRPAERHDVVVVGARVAGAATAMLLARAGHDVALVYSGHVPLGHPLHPRHRPQRRAAAPPMGAVRRGGGQRRPGSCAPSRSTAVTTVVSRTLQGPVTASTPSWRRDGSSSMPSAADVARAAGVTIETGVTARGRGAGGRAGSRVCAGASAAGGMGAGERGAVGPHSAPVPGGAAGVGAAVVTWSGPGSGRPTSRTWPATGPPSSTTWPPGALGGVFPTHHGEACVWICVPADVASRRSPPPPSHVDAAFLAR